MSKKIKPFSNGTDAMIWAENNCNICKTSKGCSGKKNIDFGFAFGEITIKSAEFIGYNGIELNQKCNHFNNRIGKTVDCQECENHSFTIDPDQPPYDSDLFNVLGFYKSELVCSKDHKPKFYQPKDETALVHGDYGYKKKCNDFKHKT